MIQIGSLQVDPSAWTAYTPTVDASAGTITTLGAVSGRYKLIGKTCFFQVSAAITTNGTGSGRLRATLPFTATATGTSVISGREDAGAGKMLQGLILATGIRVTIVNYDNTYPVVDGSQIYVSGSYEIA